MSFFDSKEEVINIELTSYGKLLLSKGMLKPSYYSFHDDDILYDTAYVNNQNNSSTSEVRIQEETPYLKPLYSFSSLKASLEKEIDQENFIKSISNLDIYKVDYFNNSLGNSTISNLYSPAWKISNLSTQFISINTTFGNKNIKIPQFECVLTSSFYKINNSTVISQELQNIIDEKSFNIINIDDETFVFNDSQELVLNIQELNTDVEHDKFDIEIFKVDSNNNNEESYKLLKFYKNFSFVDENNFLVNLVAENLTLDDEESYADKWLNVSADSLIDTTIACKHILKSTANQDNIFKDINICNNITTRYTTNNLYEIINTATGKNC